jgi:hypothetical protein
MGHSSSFDPLPAREVLGKVSSSAASAGPVRSRATAALATLAVAFIALQPISDAVFPGSLRELLGNDSAAAQWNRYASVPAPDVLIVGDSRARVDVQGSVVSALLSSVAGRSLTVGNLGVNAEQPAFLDALIYRILHRTSRPSMLILNLSEYQFNVHYTYDSTEDLWQISDPFDLGFMSRALQDATHPGRLVRGWMLPVFADYPVIVRAIRCGSAPFADPETCNQLPKTAAEQAAYYTQRFHEVMADYQFSEAQTSHVLGAASMAKEYGVHFGLAILPVLGIPKTEAVGYSRFESGAQDLAKRMSVPLLDFHDLFQDQPGYWSDPNHLNAKGAGELAPYLATALADALPGT